jgi:hypothetical protein
MPDFTVTEAKGKMVRYQPPADGAPCYNEAGLIDIAIGEETQRNLFFLNLQSRDFKTEGSGVKPPSTTFAKERMP